MKIVFFGSSDFAVNPLKALLTTKHEISAVVTQPDKKRGRGLFLSTTTIKKTALESGLKIYQPKQINTLQTKEFLEKLAPDLFIVVAYGQILFQTILDIPKILPINIHASLLPKYRGAAPINRSLIAGEKTTGTTIIKMTKEMDAGQIIAQRTTIIAETDDAVTLRNKLSLEGTELLIESLEIIENKTYCLIPQDEKEVSFAPRMKKEEGLINWGYPAQEIYNLIRGCAGWPGAFTYYKGKLLKIFMAMVSACEDSTIKYTPGEIIRAEKKGILVATGKGNLMIKELQLEGKKRMSAENFISGQKIRGGEKMGNKK